MSNSLESGSFLQLWMSNWVPQPVAVGYSKSNVLLSVFKLYTIQFILVLIFWVNRRTLIHHSMLKFSLVHFFHFPVYLQRNFLFFFFIVCLKLLFSHSCLKEVALRYLEHFVLAKVSCHPHSSKLCYVLCRGIFGSYS